MHKLSPSVAPAPSPAPRGSRLGDLLVAKGYITEEQLSAALLESRATGEILGKTLVVNGYVFESELSRTLAEQWRLPYVNLAAVGVDPETARALPRSVGEKFGSIPVRKVRGEVQVAFVDPSDERAVASVLDYIPLVTPAVADNSDIVMAWRSIPS